MSKVQTKQRKRSWPRPKCDVCKNVINRHHEAQFDNPGVRHTLCRS